jgi:hypothetical protein
MIEGTNCASRAEITGIARGNIGADVKIDASMMTETFADLPKDTIF